MERVILVTGATGTVGQQVVSGLLDRGVKVRALSRHAGAGDLPPGAEAVGRSDRSRSAG